MRLPNSDWKKIKRRKFIHSITLFSKYICICYIENRDKLPYPYQQEISFTVKNSCLQVFFWTKRNSGAQRVYNSRVYCSTLFGAIPADNSSWKIREWITLSLLLSSVEIWTSSNKKLPIWLHCIALKYLSISMTFLIGFK